MILQDFLWKNKDWTLLPTIVIPPPETSLKPREFAPAHDFWFIWNKTKYQLQNFQSFDFFLVLLGAGRQFEKNLGALSSYIHKIIYGHKKYAGKKNTPGKKKYRWTQKGVSECGKKKYSRKKKNTADQQKEWVSGSTIFSREKKNTRPLPWI